jgi:TetR/AcrR family transcriptional regulator, transcriptional repressor for nem operon
MPTPQAVRTDATKRKLLDAAFVEVFHNGYGAASLNSIVDAARITKGALFHHFESKQALGYALVDDVLTPVLSQRWLEPLADTDDPITALQDAFRRHIADDTGSGNLIYGCPMNNLAQEMSPLDDGFRRRFDAMYETWRRTIAAAVARGQRAGNVRRDIDARSVATLVVVGQIGVWSTAKHSQNAKLMNQAGEAICAVLETFRADRAPQRRGRRK